LISLKLEPVVLSRPARTVAGSYSSAGFVLEAPGPSTDENSPRGGTVRHGVLGSAIHASAPSPALALYIFYIFPFVDVARSPPPPLFSSFPSSGTMPRCFPPHLNLVSHVISSHPTLHSCLGPWLRGFDLHASCHFSRARFPQLPSSPTA